MADTAFTKQYRQEYIAGFEQSQALLRGCCVTEFVRQGNEAIFLVADTNDAEPVTRGINGMIPARSDNLTQSTATLVEWHDKVRKTKFNAFASQGDARRIMQDGSIKVINRKIDQSVLTQLNTATNDTGTAVEASHSLIMKAITILGNNDVDLEEEDNMFAVISPAMRGFMMQVKEYINGEYIDVKLLNGPVRKVWRAMGINWITHSKVPGVATAAEKCFIFHRNAIGHAADMEGADIAGGYNEEDSYYWARTSVFMGSKLLQNSGVVVINHDGSRYVAS